MKKLFIAMTFLLTAATTQAQQLPVYLDNSKPVEQRIDDAISRMTLDEKIAIIHAQSKFSSRGVPRLGFPDFWTDDGPHGVRPDVLWDEWVQAGQNNDSCVAFPALTCLAASWNPQVAWNYGHALGEEARYRGKDMMLGPGVNIYRSPLNGRNFEYMGEDPWLSSVMVVPYVQGLQQTGVSACVKHYALNNSEEYRHQVNVIVDDRTLHELYLPAFKAAVQKGGTWAIMGAYNLYKDEHNCHNATMLNKILKGDWQFDGVVVSDWGGTHDTEQAITNGLDMEFGSWTNGLTMGASNAYDNYYLAEPYKKLIREGKYTEKELNDKVRRVLRLYYRTTMNPNRAQGFLCSEAHYATAQQIGHEGVVLLKNDRQVLPLQLQKARRILVVGENAIKMMTVGGGSSSLKAQHEISPLDGLKNYITKHGLSVSVDYARGYVGDTTGNYNGVTTGQNLVDHRSSAELIAEAVKKAKEADYVIFVGGLNKSDYQDCEGHDRTQYELPYGQDQVIAALAKANKKVVCVNISGNAVAMPWVKQVPVIVQGWFLGSEAGTILADVLTGEVNPSGKLPFTWPVQLSDVPCHKLDAWHGTWRPDHKIIDEEYKEGFYVGYRGVDHYKTRPLFAFGHGLSYTTFKVAGAKLAKQTADSLTFTVSLTNTGRREGAEIVQLYVHQDRPSLERPVKELKGFQKVSLKAGETKTVTISVARQDLGFYDDQQQCWKTEEGSYQAFIGTASDNLPLTVKFVLGKIKG